jgi:hypothetical protein
MAPRSGLQLLQLPVQLRGIWLCRPVDLLLDATAWRVIGFVVLCDDESRRFLPYAAADLREDEIAVPSALLLLDDIEFYRDHSRSLRTLVGAAVASERRELGELRDLFVAADGSVASLLVGQDGALREVEPAGARIGLAPAA